MEPLTLSKSDVTSVIGWRELLAWGLEGMMAHWPKHKIIGKEHIQDTPQRVVKAYSDYFRGNYEDPKEVLKTTFKDGDYDEMVYVNNIEFVSFCAHHLVPFIGRCHFAYIPDKRIVGLSKMARLVDCYARRPQVQEKLSSDIVNSFQAIVRPKGCGVVIEAVHLCMVARGVEKEQAYTRTTALRGCFKKSDVKVEFLSGLPQGGKIWM